MLTMTAEAIARMRALGIATFHAPGFSLSEDCVFEPPCSIKWLQLPYTFRMGAFSYGVSGYFFACVLGRYVSIGEDVQIGRHGHPTEWASTSPLFYQWPSQVLDLEIEAAAQVAPNDFMLGQSGQAVKTTQIGNDVWIGHGAFIAPGVVIGDGAVVGAQSVVTKDVPPYAIVAGVPAKVIRPRFSDEIVERMLKARWWRYAFWDLKGASVTDPLRFLAHVEQLADDNLAEYNPALVSVRDICQPNESKGDPTTSSSDPGNAMP